jgi:hypothetical protein
MSSQAELDKQILDGIQQCARNMAQAIETARRTCLRCTHFNQITEICALAQQRPPARVIALACKKFEDDGIPF